MKLDELNFPDDLKKLDHNELKELASEIRNFLIEKVQKTGGHLSPNLGVVELTLALHRIFNFPDDDLIWDVGHQSYVHKILTGRKNQFDLLRKKNGLSGYPSPAESEYDVIHSGHSSTSLSIASGIAQSKVSRGELSATVAVIGDGAFTAGMVYEALNTIAHHQLPVIIILNDNGMSISKNVGGISEYFAMLQSSAPYLKLKKKIVSMEEQLPVVGKPIVSFLYRAKEAMKNIFISKNFFEDMDIAYIGPVNGHDCEQLITVFQEVVDFRRPVIIHTVTVKGKGYRPSEKNPGKYHGVPGISINGDDSIPLPGSEESFSQRFGRVLTDIAEKDDLVYAVTAAMKSGTGLNSFAEKFPARIMDVGIAEQHAVDFALGLSLKGLKPVVAIYSTFLQRAYDQLIHDVGISGAPVLFCIDRAGLVPGDGETHQGVFDIAYLKTVPGMKVMMPATGVELEMMMRETLRSLDGPVAVRYAKEEAGECEGYDPAAHPITDGEGVVALEGSDVLAVAAGSVFKKVFLAAVDLKNNHQISVEVFNLRFVNPINNKVIKYFACKEIPIIIYEEGIEEGGYAVEIKNRILSIRSTAKVFIHVLPTAYPGVDTREGLLETYGFSEQKISEELVRVKGNLQEEE